MNQKNNPVLESTQLGFVDCIETQMEFGLHSKLTFSLCIESVDENIIDVATINAALCTFIRKELAKANATNVTAKTVPTVASETTIPAAILIN